MLTACASISLQQPNSCAPIFFFFLNRQAFEGSGLLMMFDITNSLNAL